MSRPGRMILGLAVLALLLGVVFLYRPKPTEPTTTAIPPIGAPRAARPTSSASPSAAAPIVPLSLDPGDAAARDGSARAQVAFLKWGGGPRELGRLRRQEGNPEGPMAVGNDGHGGIVIVDQVNGRLMHLASDGTTTSFRISDSAQDVAMSANGTAAVLDRLGDKSVSLYGRDGKPVGTLPLEGAGIAETGQITGVFVDGDDVYIEREHGQLVRVGDVRGDSGGARTEIPGRPSRDGSSYIGAFLEQGRVYVTATLKKASQHLYTRALPPGIPARGILLLDTDRVGTIYVATTGANADGTPAEELVCCALSDGHVIGMTAMTANTLPEETFRELVVLDEGGVLHMEMSDDGVAYVRYDCR